MSSLKCIENGSRAAFILLAKWLGGWAAITPDITRQLASLRRSAD